MKKGGEIPQLDTSDALSYPNFLAAGLGRGAVVNMKRNGYTAIHAAFSLSSPSTPDRDLRKMADEFQDILCQDWSRKGLREIAVPLP